MLHSRHLHFNTLFDTTVDVWLSLIVGFYIAIAEYYIVPGVVDKCCELVLVIPCVGHWIQLIRTFFALGVHMSYHTGAQCFTDNTYYICDATDLCALWRHQLLCQLPILTRACSVRVNHTHVKLLLQEFGIKRFSLCLIWLVNSTINDKANNPVSKTMQFSACMVFGFFNSPCLSPLSA